MLMISKHGLHNRAINTHLKWSGRHPLEPSSNREEKAWQAFQGGRPCFNCRHITEAARASGQAAAEAATATADMRAARAASGCVPSWWCSPAPPPCDGRTPLKDLSDYSCWSNAAQEGGTICTPMLGCSGPKTWPQWQQLLYQLLTPRPF